jgi:coproporphyrinogen III oxidase
MSLPLEARWEYGHEPEPEGAEAATLAVLREPREWA